MNDMTTKNAGPFTDWLRFQKFAQKNGFDSLQFMALFPGGLKKCRWLDAYFGFVAVEGINGFVTVDQLDEQVPGTVCIVIGEEG